MAKLPIAWRAYAAQTDGSGRCFRISIQDPPSISQIRRALSDPRLRLLPQVEVDSLEVALDAWPRNGWDEIESVKVALLSVLTMGQRLPSLRILSPEHRSPVGYRVDVRPTWSVLANGFLSGGTAYIGDRSGSVSYKCYLKKRDRAAELPENEWRVRFELTLRADGLSGVKTLEDLQRLSFERLGRFFPVYVEKAHCGRRPAAREIILEKLGENQPRLVDRYFCSKRRKKPKALRAD